MAAADSQAMFNGGPADEGRGLKNAWRLIVSDYYRGLRLQTREPKRMRRLMVARLLTNSSLHANVLVRLMVACPVGFRTSGGES